jgi:protein involved in sex pheromone biosynthesis
MSHFSVIWNNQGRMASTSPGFVSIVCSTNYVSNAMKKVKTETELRKMQQLELEKWTKFVTDGVLQEPVCRSEQTAIRTTTLGQQSEVSCCFAFLFEKPHSCVGGI